MENLLLFGFLVIIVYLIIHYLKKCKVFKENFSNNNFNTANNSNNVNNAGIDINSNLHLKDELTKSLGTAIIKNKQLKNKLYDDIKNIGELKNITPEFIKLMELDIDNDSIPKTNDVNVNLQQELAQNIKNVSSSLDELEKKVYQKKINKFNSRIKPNLVVKSLENGMKITLEKDTNSNKFRVYANNKCLNVDDIGDYNLQKCDINNQNQLFDVVNVFNPETYLEKVIEPNMTLQNTEENINTLRYPFSVIKSTVNNNCLQNNSNQISVRPCEAKLSQRWNLLEQTNNCINNDEHKC